MRGRNIKLGPHVLAVVLVILFCFLIAFEVRAEGPVTSEALVHLMDKQGNHALSVLTVAGKGFLMCHGMYEQLPLVQCLRLTGERGAYNLAIAESVTTAIVVGVDT